MSQSAETQFCQTASRYGCNSLVANLNNLGSYKAPPPPPLPRGSCLWTWECEGFLALAHPLVRVGDLYFPLPSPPQVPKVLFTSYSSYYGAFSVQSPPYKSRFVQDAGGVYPDLSAFDAFKEMHWTGTQVSAFRFPGTNLSQFHAGEGPW